MMAKIQQANTDSDKGPSYDSTFISEARTPLTSFINPLFSKSDHEQTYHEQPKIIYTNGDEQMNRDIICDDPNVEVNDGSVGHNKNAHDQHDNELELLARNAYKEAEKQLILAKKVKQQNVELTKQLEQYKERVRVFETTKANKTNFHNEYIEADQRAKKFENQFQAQFIQDRDKIRTLEKQRYDLQMSVSNEKNSSNVRANVCYTEEILEDATQSQIKMNNKLKDPIANKKKQNFLPINYGKLNDLYKTFLPQVEISLEQKYFLEASTSTVTPINASKSSSPPRTMPKSSKMIRHFHKLEKEINKLYTLLEDKTAIKSIFFTNRKDIILCRFFYDEVKPILNYLHTVCKAIQTEFPEELKAMMDIFDSMESDLDETLRQNENLNDRLLKATLIHDVEKCVLMCSDSMNDKLHDEIV
ncbi:hypothetical protein Tco_0267213 [Tanacetum coccineum]